MLINNKPNIIEWVETAKYTYTSVIQNMSLFKLFIQHTRLGL